MYKFFVLTICLGAVTAVPRMPQRIVGGALATVQQYPSMVALLWSYNQNIYSQACGGTILNQKSIITAAHCTYGDPVGSWRVRVGSSYANSGGTVHSAAKIIHHPYFNSISDNDVAIIRTSSSIVYTNSVKAAYIASASYNLGDNQVVWAAGWGTTVVGGSASEQLRHVQIWTINQATCKNNYAAIGYQVTDNMLCSGWLGVGGRDQCQGDSGGPLYHNNVLVGICSWGYRCALAQYPGVNTRVSRYASWISANA